MTFRSIQRVLTLCACGLVACETPPPPVDRPEMSFTGLRIHDYNRGVETFTAQANAAHGDKNELTLDEVKVQHRGIKESGALNINATHAIIRSNVNGLEMTEGVRIEDSFGRVLTTERVVYAPDQDAVSIPGELTLRGPDMTVKGKAVVGTLGREEFTLQGPIEGQFSPHASAP